MEIGSAALTILVECWDGHLTPPEVASLADRASRARDSNMVRAAAELALSCLPHAHALNPNEIQRALVQCKEQVFLYAIGDLLWDIWAGRLGMEKTDGPGLDFTILAFMNYPIGPLMVTADIVMCFNIHYILYNSKDRTIPILERLSLVYYLDYLHWGWSPWGRPEGDDGSWLGVAKSGWNWDCNLGLDFYWSTEICSLSM